MSAVAANMACLLVMTVLSPDNYDVQLGHISGAASKKLYNIRSINGECRRHHMVLRGLQALGRLIGRKCQYLNGLYSYGYLLEIMGDVPEAGNSRTKLRLKRVAPADLIGVADERTCLGLLKLKPEYRCYRLLTQTIFSRASNSAAPG
jgi:hypothetical protein